MLFVTAAPETVAAAATDFARIGSALSTANAGAAATTTQIVAAAEDEVSAAIAAVFSAHSHGYQGISTHAAASHARSVQALTAGADAYASAKAASVSPLHGVLNAIDGPVQTLTGRPLIGNGARGAPVTAVKAASAPPGQARAARRAAPAAPAAPPAAPAPAATAGSWWVKMGSTDWRSRAGHRVAISIRPQHRASQPRPWIPSIRANERVRSRRQFIRSATQGCKNHGQQTHRDDQGRRRCWQATRVVASRQQG
ncbi:PE domain-containing protein [Mycobacterium spongiae]|uniref:PE domain-containing protein n=1 Tax=Mycobacterium spongiae TaxID=886343 RepID=A0A975JZT4_9MYCO|nr:PE domain-containing protein [Mycobacterium spongiae]